MARSKSSEKYECEERRQVYIGGYHLQAWLFWEIGCRWWAPYTGCAQEGILCALVRALRFDLKSGLMDGSALQTKQSKLKRSLWYCKLVKLFLRKSSSLTSSSWIIISLSDNGEKVSFREATIICT